MEEKVQGKAEELALAQNLSQLFQKMIIIVPALANELQVPVINLEKQPVQLSNFIASGLDIDLEQKQSL